MADVVDKIVFTGELNYDDNVLAFPDGDWRYALNVMISKTAGDQRYAVKGLLGNVLKDNSAITGSTNFILGVAADYENRRLYYLVRDTASSPPDAIYYYDIEDETHTLVLEDDELFHETIEQIEGIDFVDGLLYWTFIPGSSGPGFGGGFTASPRKINVDKAILFTSSGGSDPNGYPNIDLQTLEAACYPHSKNLRIEYVNDSSLKSNHLYGKILQFSARYIYDDGEISAWSTYTEVVIPYAHEDMSGRRLFSADVQNAIDVYLNTGHHTVEYIDLAVRDSNEGVFGIFKRIDKAEDSLSDNASHSVRYYGTEALTFVDRMPNYDLMPRQAGDQVLINDNQIVYADLLEGYNRPDVSWSLTLLYDRLQHLEFGIIVHRQIPQTPPTGSGEDRGYLQIPSGSVLAGTILTIRVGDTTGPQGLIIHPVTAEEAQDPNFLATNLHDEIEAEGYGADVITTDYFGLNPSNNDTVRLDDGYYFWGSDLDSQVYSDVDNEVFLFTLNDVSEPIEKNFTFKKGARHPLGIVYYDRINRDSGVASELVKYVPFPPEVDLTNEGLNADDDEYKIRMYAQISSTPPEWACYYQFVYKGNDRCLSVMQRTIRDIGVEGRRIKISLERYYNDNYQGASYQHDITEGDMVRFMTQYAWDGANIDREYIANYAEFQVLEFVPGGGGAGEDVIYVEFFDYEEENLEGSSLIEIYTPKKNIEDAPYYEFGKRYLILEPGESTRRHDGEEVRSIEIISATADEVILFGDYRWAVAGELSITGSIASDGDYTIDSGTAPSYDWATNQTTITITASLGTAILPGNSAEATINTAQNSTHTENAVCLIDTSDCYIRKRTMGTGFSASNPQSIDYFCETMSQSDYYDSDSWDKGRLQVFDPKATEKRLKTGLRHSQKKIENTAVNGLSTFFYEDYDQVDLVNGGILGVEQIGFTLKVLQERKNTSIYINRRETYSQSTGDMVLVEEIFGSKRPMPQDWGLQRKEARIQWDNYLLYWDMVNGNIVLDNGEGQAIVNGKMDSFWKEQSRFFIDEANPENAVVRMGLDRRRNLIWITVAGLLADGGSIPVFSIGFDYLEGKWKTFRDNQPSFYLDYGDKLFTAVRLTGKMYEEHVGTVGNFFGSDEDSQVKIVSNIHPDHRKIFKAIAEKANSKWPVSSMIIAATGDYTEMESEVMEGMLEAYEGEYCAAILYDKNTPNVASADLALIDGREMRGHAATFTLDNSDTSNRLLEYVKIRCQISEPIT